MSDLKKIKIRGGELRILSPEMSFSLLPGAVPSPIKVRRASKSESAAYFSDELPNANTKQGNSCDNKQNSERLIVSWMSRHFVALAAAYHFSKRVIYPFSHSQQPNLSLK
jgi:hypothetical protein